MAYSWGRGRDPRSPQGENLKEQVMSVYNYKNAAEAREAVQRVRQVISDHAASAHYEYLNSSLLELAELQGAVYVLEGLENLDHTSTVDKVEYLTSLLSRGAEDTSSGRGNDARRAFGDGVRFTATRKLGSLFRRLDDELDAIKEKS